MLVGQPILLRGAKQLLTLRGPKGARRGAALHDLGIVEDGSVLIQDGVIIEVGSTRRIENLKLARAALEIAVDGNIVMPGFVDPSLHLTLEGRAKRKNISEFYDHSLAILRGCLQHGTLTAGVKTISRGDLHADMSGLRQLARIGNEPVGMVRAWQLEPLLATQPELPGAVHETLEVLAARKLVDCIELAAPSETAPSNAVFTAAEDIGLPLHVLWPGGSPAVLAEILARFRPLSVKCPSQLTLGECDVLARWPGVTVFAPGREIIEERNDWVLELAESGAAIALASGYHATQAPSFSMQMVVALATLRLGLAPEAAITASTINAAYALGCGHITGSIEHGKRADLLVITIPDYREIPRRFGINHVGIAIRGGNIVLNRTRWKIGA